MIIWINGAFGAGKTQTAYELRRRIKHAYVYDPENAGYFIRENVPPAIREGDFQDYPMWRTFNREMLDYIASRFSGVILVPMTVTDRAYWDEMAGALAEKHGVRHFILCARRETLLRRLASRLEQAGLPAKTVLLNCGTGFVPHGAANLLKRDLSLDGEGIFKKALEVLGRGETAP